MRSPLYGLGFPVYDYPYPIWIVEWVAMVVLADVIAGGLASYQIDKLKVFSLPRAGWKRWCRKILAQSILVAVAYTAVIVAVAWLTNDRTMLWISGLLMASNLALLLILQSMLQMATENMTLSMLTVFMIQLVSFLCSMYLGKFAWILPGNWGIILRTNLYDEAGFSIPSILLLEWVVICIVTLFGWRIVKSVMLQRNGGANYG
jgi:hypothetical protein